MKVKEDLNSHLNSVIPGNKRDKRLTSVISLTLSKILKTECRQKEDDVFNNPLASLAC